MGNTASNPTRPSQPSAPAPAAPLPQPVPVTSNQRPPPTASRPLKSKKRSLELPDLSLALTPAFPTPKSRPIRASSPIPIPASNHRSSYNRTYSDSPRDMSHTIAPSEPQARVHPIHHPPPEAGPSTGYLPRQTSSTSLLSGRRSARPSAPKQKKFKRTRISASIPTGIPDIDNPAPKVQGGPGLPTVAEGSEQEEEVELVTVHIKWREGGHTVQVAATWDDPPWSNRKVMTWDQESGCHRMTVRLPPGSHRLKFIQDDIWRCSSHMPTATDDAGNLVNYIEVRSKRKNSEISGKVNEWGSAWWGDGSSDSEDEEAGAWTSHIPPRLFKAAAEEEAYLQLTSNNPNYNEFDQPHPPAIPSPPALPRHLEKLILNAKTSSSRHHGHSTTPPVLSTGAGGTSERRSTRKSRSSRLDDNNGDDTSVLPVPSHSVVNHLGTSAIRNGVLAVGTTTRYKSKYISTVYYYPT